MDSELKQLEEELRGFAPSPVSGEVLSRMVEAMERWEEEVPSEIEDTESGKIVAFPKERKDGSSWGVMWAAAAAVAVLGAALGVLVPQNEAEMVAEAQGLGPVPVLRQASLVPVNVQRKIRSMDARKVSNKDGLEHQVIRVVRQEEADFRGTDTVSYTHLTLPTICSV